MIISEFFLVYSFVVGISVISCLNAYILSYLLGDYLKTDIFSYLFGDYYFFGVWESLLNESL